MIPTSPIKTLFLTSPDPVLERGVRAVRPDLQLVQLDPAGDAFLDGPGPSWCFVDWLLPDMSGIEVVRRLRDSSETRAAHITMVLEAADREERRRALKAGADDYMIGPLDAAALLDRLARYEAASSAPQTRSRLINGDLTLDLAAHQVRFRGQPVAMRPKEFCLLTQFMEHPDQVFSRTALIDRLGGESGEIDERTVDVWVGRLRRALIAAGAPDPLRTVRSLGYVMDSVEG